jgi:tRNA threonylcarbamoyladenosine biosynthesis protein TsaE
MQREYISCSEDETAEFARLAAIDAQPGDILCLTGDLGSGKTVFAKGFGRGLVVVSEIVSPTFTIVNVYDMPGQRMPFFHFDVYRIEYADEMEDAGYEDYFYGNGVCLIEWAEIIRDLIPPHAMWIQIMKDLNISDDYRKITINSLK